MSTAPVNGRNCSYTEHGNGPLAVLVMGTGSPGRVWHGHQVPALTTAGYRVVTPDNRGLEPGDGTDFGMAELVGDLAGLLDHLDAGPAVLIGTSLGARIVAELALERPELVDRMVLMATCGRPEPVQDTLTRGECALHDEGIVLPPDYYAAITALQNLSPATLRDPVAVRDWLDLFALQGSAVTEGVRTQYSVQLRDFPDRLADYRRITAPALVIGFADDLMVPPELGREVAEAIPAAQYTELADCGHFGYLERPEAVHEAISRFLRETEGGNR
ncbi:alpha/beta fold hydrolase [Sciscionella marina]|uniref:alpha/beta fold hydrolase n=1 Tax=Sciscionella marina TaxID=508770 RepID=UPI00036FF9C8|nr:alpha/beta fold hydrolase [Sciscionella marina]